MRLSEAMLLGDSMRRRTNSVYLLGEQGEYCGCAIGGALLAVGVGRSIGENNLFAISRVFPWIMDVWKQDIEWKVKIAFTKNEEDPSFQKVLEGKCTFEQLVDYVRSVEPDCGTCCSFTCTCKTVEPELEVAEAVSVR